MAVMQSCLPAHFTTYAPSLRHDLFHLPVVRGLLACVSLVLQFLQRVDCRWLIVVCLRCQERRLGHVPRDRTMTHRTLVLESRLQLQVVMMKRATSSNDDP